MRKIEPYTLPVHQTLLCPTIMIKTLLQKLFYNDIGQIQQLKSIELYNSSYSTLPKYYLQETT